MPFSFRSRPPTPSEASTEAASAENQVAACSEECPATASESSEKPASSDESGISLGPPDAPANVGQTVVADPFNVTDTTDTVPVMSPAPSEETEPGGQMLAEIKALMMQLAKDFEGKLKYDATKQGQIDKLYNETQDYKQGILRKFQQSLILAVVEQIDQASKQIAFFDQAEFSETTFRKLIASYQDIATCFQDMLTEKFSVSVYRCEPNTRFDPKRQRTLKTAPTRDPALNKQVKASLRPGYESEDGIVVRPELVEVYIFDEKATSPE